MAVRPGEENVATLFGDIHYFYGPPTANPPHHRFDKGSYVYLFENANDRRARIEIANQPGTDNQDAFDGFLDHTRVAYSYRHQCLVNIIVDGIPGAQVDQNEWHLPTYDPHNQNKYHYKLHSLDIYFWTQTDALQFVNGIRRVLPQAQVEVADEPPPPPLPQQQQQQHPYGHQSQDAVNPLVQKLENVAVSDPTYSSPKPTQQNVPAFAAPPGATAGEGGVSRSGGGTPSSQQQQPPQQAPPLQQEQQQQPVQFAPMAYNPAAPAAPEQIQHREKTPPPLEADGYDPLAAAVARDHGIPAPLPGGGGPPPPPPFSPGFPPTTASAPPHQHQHQGGGGLTSPGLPPPQSAQFAHPQRSATMPVSGLASPGLASPGLASPGLASPYGATFPGSPGFAPPPPPPTQPSAGGLPGQAYQAAHHQATPPPAVQSPGLVAPPPGGFAQYTYGGSAGAGAPGVPDYGIHQQVYRPTETEAFNAKYGDDRYKPGATADGKPSRLGQNAERLEKGVTGMLKRFEKKFG